MIKAVLVVKGKEPEVVKIQDNMRCYYKTIEEALTPEELALSPVYGLDFFSVEGLKNIAGMIEDESALYPYERNRSWHGPALFTEFDMEGKTISMSDENIDKLLKLYSLDNEIKSPSNFINEFLNKYAKQEIFNCEYKRHIATLSTMDAVDMIKREKDKEQINNIEQMLMFVRDKALVEETEISDVLTNYLKSILEYDFEQQADEFDKRFPMFQ